MFADRMRLIDSSGIRKVFDLAQRLKEPINLSIGQPDFDVPEAARSAALRAIETGRNKYTPTQGIAELTAALREYVRPRMDPEGKGLLVTSGVSGGLLLSLLVLVNPGDEVLITDPCFVMYAHLVNLCGGTPRYVDTYPDFMLRPEALAEALTDRTKCLILNSPTNPTGAVYPRATLEAIAALARRRNLLIISDECYHEFAYDGACPSIAQVYEHTLLLDGFSKTFGAPGWRVGFAVGPKEIVEKMTMLQQYSFVCAPSMAQYGVLAGLLDDGLPDVTASIRAAYARKRDLVYEGLRQAFEVVKPQGAFYIFPRVPEGLTATAFVERAIANNVLIIPGGVFSRRDTHCRISYATDERTLERGVEVLCRLAQG
jgi:aspartate/methionine/tyrosine aminotransferase